MLKRFVSYVIRRFGLGFIGDPSPDPLPPSAGKERDIYVDGRSDSASLLNSDPDAGAVGEASKNGSAERTGSKENKAMSSGDVRQSQQTGFSFYRDRKSARERLAVKAKEAKNDKLAFYHLCQTAKHMFLLAKSSDGPAAREYLSAAQGFLRLAVEMKERIRPGAEAKL